MVKGSTGLSRAMAPTNTKVQSHRFSIFVVMNVRSVPSLTTPEDELGLITDVVMDISQHRTHG
jgi:hypothetical protein